MILLEKGVFLLDDSDVQPKEITLDFRSFTPLSKDASSSVSNVQLAFLLGEKVQCRLAMGGESDAVQ